MQSTASAQHHDKRSMRTYFATCKTVQIVICSRIEPATAHSNCTSNCMTYVIKHAQEVMMAESCPSLQPKGRRPEGCRQGQDSAIMTDRACLIWFLTARSNILGKVKGRKLFPKWRHTVLTFPKWRQTVLKFPKWRQTVLMAWLCPRREDRLLAMARATVTCYVRKSNPANNTVPYHRTRLTGTRLLTDQQLNRRVPR